MKLLVIPKNKDDFSEIVDGYILPLEKFSVSYSLKYSLEEVKLIVQDGKKVFVVLNKNIFNDELEELEKTLLILNEIGVSGVFFYDLSILSIVRRLGLSLPLIWNQTHMVTNYNTVNYYADKGVTGAMLANEITLEEMEEIRKNTEVELFLNIIYQPVMSFSRRSLVSNFYKSSKVLDAPPSIVVHEKITGEDFLVREENDGTSFFYGKVINGLCALPTMVQAGFDFGIVDLPCLEDNVEVCLKVVRDIMDGKEDVDVSLVSKLIGENTGFLYKKTIYRVK